MRLRVKETGWIEGADLKAEEYGVFRETGFLGCHANIRGIVTGHFLRVGADNDRDNQRLPINGIR